MIISLPSARQTHMMKRRRKRRREIPIFLLNTSCPVTHSDKHFPVQRQLTGSDHGFWQRDSFDVPEHMNQESEQESERGQHKNRLTSDFFGKQNYGSLICLSMSFMKEIKRHSQCSHKGREQRGRANLVAAICCSPRLSSSVFALFSFILLLFFMCRLLSHIGEWMCVHGDFFH